MGNDKRPCWFVGAYIDDKDYTEEFVRDGVWRNGGSKYANKVMDVRVGDRIAIKANSVVKHSLPFEANGRSVSRMLIKAAGTVTENAGDGVSLRVDWKQFGSPKEWYFFTYQKRIWRVEPGTWEKDALIDFAFNDKPQEIERFRNAPFWRERYGDLMEDRSRFPWTEFYQSVADRILSYRDRRDEFVEKIHEIVDEVEALAANTYLDKTDGKLLDDICPFTAMALFNRGWTPAKRREIASKFAEKMEVSVGPPPTFEGIPVVPHRNRWFFSHSRKRSDGDIDKLWAVFGALVEYTRSTSDESRDALVAAIDEAQTVRQVGWNLFIGFFWIRPWDFVPLDEGSRAYVSKEFGVEIPLDGVKRRISGASYLELVDQLEEMFHNDGSPVHSFPELSYAAYHDKPDAVPEVDEDESDHEDEVTLTANRYTTDDCLAEGCFVEEARLDGIVKQLKTKKNLILQGPPGTGKTWLAKRLAYLVMGEKRRERIRSVQFHPSLSYEDFVRGWRPTSDGRLSLVDGPFLQMVEQAKREPDNAVAVVVEEINRGNPAQVFGELLTLLEATKRNPDDGMALCYPKDETERVWIPRNLYLIGTMNVADRSLALVDFAFRRRFAFVNMYPNLGEVWLKWVESRSGIPREFLQHVQQRIASANRQIANDPNLGEQFQIGHSYVMPDSSYVGDPARWFRQVVETEIGPLLDEYWYDDPEKSRRVQDELVAGL